MPSKEKKTWVKAFIFIGFTLLFFVVWLENPIKDSISFQIKKILTYKYNFFANNNPLVVKRTLPIGTPEKEADLEVAVGEPFISFSQKDWDEFWNILYGIYPLQEQEDPRLPKKMRQLKQVEIINELVARYPQPFAYFGGEQWGAFFALVFPTLSERASFNENTKEELPFTLGETTSGTQEVNSDSQEEVPSEVEGGQYQ